MYVQAVSSEVAKDYRSRLLAVLSLPVHQGCIRHLKILAMKSLFYFLRILSFVSLLSQSAVAILDENHDGMSDVWQAQYDFSTAANPPPEQAPTADPDADGVSNLMESIAGTNPLSAAAPAGFFRVTTSPNLTDPLALDLQWTQFIGKQYQVQSSADLGISAWASLGVPFVATSVATPFTTPPRSPVVPRQFYRVQVMDVDADDDELSNYEENILGTNTNNPDTDGDGTPDKTEIIQGSSPTNPADGGQSSIPPTPPALLPLKLKIFTYASLGATYPTTSGLLTPYTIRIMQQNITTGVETTVHETVYGGSTLFLTVNTELPNISNEPNKRYTVQIDLPTIGTGVFDQPFRDWNFYLNITSNVGGAPIAGLNGFEPISQTYGSAGHILQKVNLFNPGFENYRAVLNLVEFAPEVLPVNSDFDEGRIDPTTGYAIPDCDDTSLALEAQRAHLDGKYTVNQRITDDMYPGFFGLNPSTAVPPGFWTGATVTIGKITKNDPAMGFPESGQVRLYGKWGEGPSQYRAIIPYDFDTLVKTNLVTGGINGAPAESVYGTTSPFPANTSYFIEGVHPGKITLEWRYQKGTVLIKHEQAFEVVTRKTALEWKYELTYKIRLESSNDPSGQINTFAVNSPSESYQTRMERISEYYDFYQDCFLTPMRTPPLQNQAMGWPGLARLAGSQVVGGLSESEYGRQIAVGGAAVRTLLDPLGLLPLTFFDWPAQETERLQQELFAGARDIFRSTGWQMHAYRSSGYRALDWVAGTGERESQALVLKNVWINMRLGTLSHNTSLLNQAALDMTDREQNVTIVPTWASITSLSSGPILDWVFTQRATNPCTPSGVNFKDMFPTGSLSNTVDRWNWIQPATISGVMHTWNNIPEANRSVLVGANLKDDAKRFTLTSLGVFVWDHEDIK